MPSCRRLLAQCQAAGGFAGRLHRRQEEPDQEADNRDDYEQFDEGEAALVGIFYQFTHVCTTFNVHERLSTYADSRHRGSFAAPRRSWAVCSVASRPRP